MSLRINLNTAALSASRYLGATDNALGKSIEKLSSGYRVNRASDDPAGLVISQKLRAQIGGLGQAISNSNDAINMVKTAEGALNETHALLLSMRDLAVHAANTGVNDAASLDADQLQITSAIDSLNRIAANTQFGQKKLLDGSAGMKATVINTVDFGNITPAATTMAGYVDVDVTAAATKATYAGADLWDTDTVNDIAGGASSITINGTLISFLAADNGAQVVQKINDASDTTGVTATMNAGVITLDQTSFGTDKGIALVDADGLISATTNVVRWGTDAQANITYSDGTTTELFHSGKGLQLVGDTGGMVINLTTAGNAVADNDDAIFVTATTMTFQVGAYAGQTVDFSLNSVAATDLGGTAVGLTNTTWTVADIDVTSATGAQDALKLIDAAISEVSTTRANLGAFQKNILESNVNSLSIAKENIAASESSIRDTDMAAEMVTFTRNQILEQAGTAMLAQANQVPQTLLRLLQ